MVGKSLPPILQLHHPHLRLGEEWWRHADQALGNAAGAMGMGSYGHALALLFYRIVFYGDGAAFDPHVNHHLGPSMPSLRQIFDAKQGR